MVCQTMRIEAVLFDLGETLLNFGSVDHFASFREGACLAHRWLVEQGQAVPDFETFHRRQRRAILRAYQWSLLSGRDFSAIDVLRRCHLKMGLTTRGEDLRTLASLYYEPIRRQGTAEPKAREVLGWLRDRGCSLAIVSNTVVPGTTLDDHLESEGLLEFFPHRVYSCDTGYRKPHPRIFQIATERVGKSPLHTLFVGDTLKTDVRGANRMGMISVLKAPNGHTPKWFIRPRYVISALTELPDVVVRHESA